MKMMSFGAGTPVDLISYDPGEITQVEDEYPESFDITANFP